MKWTKVLSLLFKRRKPQKAVNIYKDWADVQLVRAISEERNQYTPEAQKLIEQELFNRKLIKHEDAKRNKEGDLEPKWLYMLPENLRPKGRKHINELDVIRKTCDANHDEFAFALLSRSAITKKVQLETYKELKSIHPDWEEKELLREVLYSRKEVAEQYGDNWLSGKINFERILKKVKTIDDLCSVIVEHERSREGVDLTGWVRDAIDKILEWEPPIRKRNKKAA